MKRRQFLKSITILAAVTVIPALMCSTPPSKESEGDYAPEWLGVDKSSGKDRTVIAIRNKHTGEVRYL